MVIPPMRRQRSPTRSAIIGSTPKGRGLRNAAINRGAFKIGGLVGAGALSESTAREGLLSAARTNGYVADHGERSSLDVIEHGLKAGIASPREINGKTHTPRPNSQHAEIISSSSTGSLPPRTTPNKYGKPKFCRWEDDGPPQRDDELRRHVYRREGMPVRIKIKSSQGDGGSFVNWYRVRDGSTVGWQPKQPSGYQPAPYVSAAIDPFDPELKDDQILWPEGERDVDTLSKLNLPAFTFGGAGDGLPDGIEQYLAGRHLVILADNDDPGRAHAEKKAERAHAAGAASIRIIHFPELPPKADVSDFINGGGNVDGLLARVDAALLWQPPNDFLLEAAANPVLIRVSDVTAQPIRWLWQHRIAYGKLSIIAGEPGLGKSQLTMHLAAAVTRGGSRWWPDCPDHIEPANVIILSAEDDIADTIRPRLEAAGADLDRVTVLKAILKEDGAGERGVNIGEDAQHIAQAIERVGGVGLIIIDPVSAYLGRMSGNNNVEVRFALAPIQALAIKYGPAVVAVSHLNKPNAGGTTALHRITGSGAFSAAARAVFLIVSQPDSGQRLFLPGKNNVGREQPGLVFEIEERDTSSGIRAPAIRWTGKSVSMTADEALAAVSGGVEEHGALAEAKNFLIDLLTAGPLPRKELEKAADGAGISDKTLRRAKTALGVVAERTGGLPGRANGHGGCPDNRSPTALRWPTIPMMAIQKQWAP